MQVQTARPQQRAMPAAVRRSFGTRFQQERTGAVVFPAQGKQRRTPWEGLVTRCVGLVHEAIQLDSVDAYEERLFASIDEFATLYRAALRLVTPGYDPNILPRFISDIERWGGTDRSELVEHAVVLFQQALRLAPKLQEEPPSDVERDGELAQRFNANFGFVSWDLTAISLVISSPSAIHPDITEAVFQGLLADASDMATATQEGYRLRYPDPDEP